MCSMMILKAALIKRHGLPSMSVHMLDRLGKHSDADALVPANERLVGSASALCYSACYSILCWRGNRVRIFLVTSGDPMAQARDRYYFDTFLLMESLTTSDSELHSMGAACGRRPCGDNCCLFKVFPRHIER